MIEERKLNQGFEWLLVVAVLGLLGVIYTLFASNLSFCSRLTKQIKVFPLVPTGGRGRAGGWDTSCAADPILFFHLWLHTAVQQQPAPTPPPARSRHPSLLRTLQTNLLTACHLSLVYVYLILLYSEDNLTDFHSISTLVEQSISHEWSSYN